MSRTSRWSSKEEQIDRCIRRHYNHKGHDALHQQRSLHEEQSVQQQRDAQRNLRAEASIFAAETPTQLNAEFRVMDQAANPGIAGS